MPPVPKRRKKRPDKPVNFKVVSVTKADAKVMVEVHHYSGKCPGIKYCFGLEEDGYLVGVVIYSVPASYTLCNGVCGPEYRDFVIELSRLVVTTDTNNAASFLISGSLASLPEHVVVSYADCNDHIGHVGYVYQATNWLYTGHGNAEPLWCHPVTGEIVSYTRRHIDDKAKKFNLLWTDLVKKKQLGKHRYVYFTGPKWFRKQAKKDLRYEVKPYPKGTTTRHDGTVHNIADHNNYQGEQYATSTDEVEQTEADDTAGQDTQGTG